LGLDASLQNCVSFDQYPTVFCKVTYDPYDSDPARRYKLVAEYIEGNILDNNITDTIYTSPDGLNWKLLKGARWYTNRMGSACNFNSSRPRSTPSIGTSTSSTATR
tara:strand:+ start:717 stop:1034 length:318 start_codon:yes stop_codon:yes gene_type:complete